MPEIGQQYISKNKFTIKRGGLKSATAKYRRNADKAGTLSQQRLLDRM